MPAALPEDWTLRTAPSGIAGSAKKLYSGSCREEEP